MMEQYSEEELMEREEKCRKSLKTLGRAIFMRLFVTGLLIFALLRSEMQLWGYGLMAFVLVINIGGSLPLLTEFKRKRLELKSIMEQYE